MINIQRVILRHSAVNSSGDSSKGSNRAISSSSTAICGRQSSGTADGKRKLHSISLQIPCFQSSRREHAVMNYLGPIVVFKVEEANCCARLQLWCFCLVIEMNVVVLMGRLNAKVIGSPKVMTKTSVGSHPWTPILLTNCHQCTTFWNEIRNTRRDSRKGSRLVCLAE